MPEYHLQNAIIFMTGATSGFGVEVACHLANKGAIVLVLARNAAKAAKLSSQYQSRFPQGKGDIVPIEGNLNSFASVVSFCEELQSSYPRLDMIIHNAGIMNFKFVETVDGIEETLQVNLLSPLLISHLLFDTLMKSASPKLIFTASALHQGKINFDELEFRKQFSSFKSYRQSKLGVILICRLLAQKLPQLPVYSQHPGMVRTELGRNAGLFSRFIFWVLGKGVEQGSKTLLHLIDSPVEELVSGEYYAEKKVKKTTPEAYELAVAEKLLAVSRDYLAPFIKKASPIFPLI